MEQLTMHTLTAPCVVKRLMLGFMLNSKEAETTLKFPLSIGISHSNTQ